MPQVDEQQNVELLSLSESNGATTLEFRRKFQACEPKDLSIEVHQETIIILSCKYLNLLSFDNCRCV